MPRLFVGIPIPDEYHARMESLSASLDARLASKVRWVRPANAHITLKFLGDVEDALLPELKTALAAISFPAFHMRVGGCGVFPNMRKPRTVWIGASKGARSCADLADRVAEAVEPLGFPREDRSFKCHLTLGRVKTQARDEWETLLGEANHIWPGYKVDRFVLWQSRLTPDGAIYTVLDEFPLSEET